MQVLGGFFIFMDTWHFVATSLKKQMVVDFPSKITALMGHVSAQNSVCQWISWSPPYPGEMRIV